MGIGFTMHKFREWEWEWPRGNGRDWEYWKPFPHTSRDKILYEFFGVDASAFGGGFHRCLESFHEVRHKRTLDRPKNTKPVGRRNGTYWETLVRLNVARNVGLKRLGSDLLAAWVLLTKIKNWNKSNLETLSCGIYPPESFPAEMQLCIRVQIAEFLSVANRILSLTGARKHPMKTLTVPGAVCPVGDVTTRWKDHRRLWKRNAGVTQSLYTGPLSKPYFSSIHG